MSAKAWWSKPEHLIRLELQINNEYLPSINKYAAHSTRHTDSVELHTVYL